MLVPVAVVVKQDELLVSLVYQGGTRTASVQFRWKLMRLDRREVNSGRR